MFRVGQPASADAKHFAGEVRARIETPLSFRVAGKLLERKVDVGDRVRKGQPLAMLDSNDYRLAVQGLKAQLASAQADSSFLRDDLARYRELLTQQVISPPEFERHETAYTTARERAAALEAQLGQALNQLNYTELHSRIAIPLSAVYTLQNQPDHPSVWLVDEQAATVKSMPVRLGETLDRERIAVEGLAAGQLLVSAGVQRLAEGQAVRLPEEPGLPKNRGGEGQP